VLPADRPIKDTGLPERFAGLAGLAPDDPMMSARLMGVITALAAEVYGLKAEVKRLQIALEGAALTSADQIEAAGRSDAMRAWFAAEEPAFARALLSPFTDPDPVPDVSERMHGS
jgi:hypothetical protein